jgi:DNA-binding transcriptional MerR regulator
MMPDDTAAGGYRMYPVNDASQADVPEITDTGPSMKETESLIEKGDDMRTEYGDYLKKMEKVPPKVGLFERIFHPFRTRKAKNAVRSKIEDEEDAEERRERSVPAPRYRNRTRRPLRAVEAQEAVEETFEEAQEEVEEEQELTMEQLRAQIKEEMRNEIRAQMGAEMARELLAEAKALIDPPSNAVVPKSEPVSRPLPPETARQPVQVVKRKRSAIRPPLAENTEGADK